VDRGAVALTGRAGDLGLSGDQGYVGGVPCLRLMSVRYRAGLPAGRPVSDSPAAIRPGVTSVLAKLGPAVGSVAQRVDAAWNGNSGHVANVEAVSTRNGSVTAVTISEDAHPNGPFDWRVIPGRRQLMAGQLHPLHRHSLTAGRLPERNVHQRRRVEHGLTSWPAGPPGTTTWNYWSGSHPVTVIRQADMNALLQQHPYLADGTFIKKDGTNAVLEVIGASYPDVSSRAAWVKANQSLRSAPGRSRTSCCRPRATAPPSRQAPATPSWRSSPQP
jgi:surface antigen